ncbi:MAG: YIP1 family protein [Acidobacteriota bacterium]|nr:YIP1 family protein [Acidobacteriota bacterium]
MERLEDLVTILYRPRETMRRILDRPDRWSLQIVFLAFVCASVNQIDARHLAEIFPAIHILTALTTVGLGIIVGGFFWIAALFVLSWIATPIGRLLGGAGTVRDVRAALAWSIVPIIWSPIYRLPLVLLGIGANINDNVSGRQAVLDFVSRGGCSILVLFFGFQLLFAIACLVLASFTIAEAQRFSTQKGFLNAVIIFALPMTLIAAAIFTMRR